MRQEEQYLKRIREGDIHGLDELVALYYPHIFRYCVWHTKDRQTAEDATQDTFLKVAAHMDGYMHQGKFKSYVYKIAANTCTDYYRRRAMEQLPDDLVADANPIEDIEAEMDMAQMLSPLSEQQREIILLRFAHELKIREIADVLNLPLRTVQSRLRSALKRLKQNWKEEC